MLPPLPSSSSSSINTQLNPTIATLVHLSPVDIVGRSDVPSLNQQSPSNSEYSNRSSQLRERTRSHEDHRTSRPETPILSAEGPNPSTSQKLRHLKEKTKNIQIGLKDLAKQRKALSTCSGPSSPRTHPYIRRGSNSSAHSVSSNLSAFRERFSSSSESASDEDDGSSRKPPSQEVLSHFRKVADDLNRRIAALSPNSFPDGLSEIVATLSDLIKADRGATTSHVLPHLTLNWLKLHSFLRFADLQTPITSTLCSTTPIARVLSLLRSHPDAKSLTFSLIHDRTLSLHWAGFGFWMRMFKDIWRAKERGSIQRSLNGKIISVIEVASADSNAWIQCVRWLGEGALLGSLGQNTLRKITDALTCGAPGTPRSAARLAIFLLIISAPAALERLPLEHIISDSITILMDEHEDSLVRCLGLQAVGCVVSRSPDTYSNRVFSPLGPLCVSIMLWKTSWQHNLREKEDEFNIPHMHPHDDAYTILSFMPWEDLQLEIRNQLQVNDRLNILEPLVSLVVDQSARDTSPPRGRRWPDTLALLLHSGLFEFLTGVLRLPMPEPDHRDYRIISRCKVDATACFMRCFEQMRALDISLLTPDVKEAITEMSKDNEHTPLTLQWQARDALITLNRLLPSAPESMSIYRRFDSTNGSTTIRPSKSANKSRGAAPSEVTERCVHWKQRMGFADSARPACEKSVEAGSVTQKISSKNEEYDGNPESCRQELHRRPAGHPDHEEYIYYLATAILAKYQKEGNIYDLYEVISLHRQALLLHPPNHPNRNQRLHNLARMLWESYRKEGDTANLHEAIDLHQQALLLRSKGHPDRLHSLQNLAISLVDRYCLEGGIDDLYTVVALYRETLLLHPVGHPDRHQSLYNLALSVMDKYGKGSGADDLHETINLLRQALHLHPTGQPEQPQRFYNLAIMLAEQYRKEANVANLHEAINLHHQALVLRPEGHPDRRHSLHSLATLLWDQYRKDGNVDDLYKAIDLYRQTLLLQPVGHEDRHQILHNFAILLWEKYGKEGLVADLSETVSLNRQALSSRPIDHPDRHQSLHNLAHCLWEKYRTEGVIADLYESIHRNRQALLFRPFNHPDRHQSLHNLAISLWDKYHKEGVITDLYETINLNRQALLFRPVTHPDRHHSLHNLALSLWDKYRKEDIPVDLYVTIYLYQEALLFRQVGHPDRHWTFHNLGIALWEKYRKESFITDLHETIDICRQTLLLRPIGHPDRRQNIQNLSVLLWDRYRRKGAINDLHGAIEAVKLLSADDPECQVTLALLERALRIFPRMAS